MNENSSNPTLDHDKLTTIEEACRDLRSIETLLFCTATAVADNDIDRLDDALDYISTCIHAARRRIEDAALPGYHEP